MPRCRAAKAAGAAGSAKLLVVLLAFAWGFNWIAAAIALREVPPWSLRFAGAGIGAVMLFSAALLTGHDLHVPRSEHLHVMVAGFFNVAAFQMLSAFAQVSGATSRAIIITYSMPIWATVLSRLVLREQLTGSASSRFAAVRRRRDDPGLAAVRRRRAALGVLFARLRVQLGLRHRLHQMDEGDGRAAGQRGLATAVRLLLHRRRHLLVRRLSAAVAGAQRRVLAVLYVGVFGVGLAHFLWWSIVGRLPTITASIGSLLVPVIGVTASAVILGERPTLPDIIGFAMIFAAAACVLLQPNVKHTEMPE